MKFTDICSEWRETCSACPTQVEGRLMDGSHFYLRYRWGVLQLGLGDSLDEAVAETCQPETPTMRLGDRLDGCLTREQWDHHAMSLFLMRAHEAARHEAPGLVGDIIQALRLVHLSGALSRSPGLRDSGSGADFTDA